MTVQSSARLGKGTSDILPHCAEIQFDLRICAWQSVSVGTWGQRAASRGMYSSKSVSLDNISSPNSFKTLDTLWSTPKHVLTISRARSHYLRAIEKFLGKVTLSGAKRISTSDRDRAPAPVATMAYRSALLRKNFLTVDMC